MGYLKRKKRVVPDWPVNIIQDDREKKPWKLNPRHFKVHVRRLEVGDYTFPTFEKTIAIEKKSGIKELVTNLGGRYRPTFKKFLNKMEAYPFRIIIVEDDLSNVEKVVRKMRTMLEPYSVYFWLSKILVVHKIPVIFVGKGRIKNQMVDELLVQIVTQAINGDL